MGDRAGRVVIESIQKEAVVTTTAANTANHRDWALILGASSGFGEATALELAKFGLDIFGVHLDRKGTLGNVERIQALIKGMGREAIFFNVNAADDKQRHEVLHDMQKVLHQAPGTMVKVLLHSLAFGTLKPYIAETHADAVNKTQVDMTLDVMAHSLVYWTQDLVARKMMGHGGRIYAMTSAGSSRVWQTYGAVSAAKCALESHIRQLALELAPLGITANAILAGVTDTPALRKIPGAEHMVKVASNKNPMGRLTTPRDVASAIAVFATPATQWVTGNTIRVDGGENIVE